MPFSNASVTIDLGNIESRLHGPVPVQALDRALNRHAQAMWAWSVPGEAQNFGAANGLIFDPVGKRVLNGALPAVKRVLRGAGVRFRIRDARRRAPRTLRCQLTQEMTLRDYQKEVVREAVTRSHGLIDIGTGGGKTLLGAAIVAELRLPTLWLVTTRALLAQTVRHLRDALGIAPGVIGEGVFAPAPLTVALVQSLMGDRGDLSKWRGGTLVMDEGHHAAATRWGEVIRRVDARHSYFLSAVPFRSGSDQARLEALAGGTLTDGKYAARYLIDHGYACPVKVEIERVRSAVSLTDKPFWMAYREGIAENEERNRHIVRIVRQDVECGHRVLVLVDLVEHGQRLEVALEGVATFVHGGLGARALRKALTEFESGDCYCLIATTQLLHEGISIVGIETLVQAGAKKSRAKVIQSIGRGMRRAPGKSHCRYVDFFDEDDVGLLRAHSRQRLAVLRREGFRVPNLEPSTPTTPPEYIPPTWAHVARTKDFLWVDGDGKVRGEGQCLTADLVPEHFCKKCPQHICKKGGDVEWQEDPA